MSNKMQIHLSLPPREVRFLDPNLQEKNLASLEGENAPGATAPAPAMDVEAMIREVEEAVQGLETRVMELAGTFQEKVIDLAISLSQHLLKSEVNRDNYDFHALLGEAVEAIEDLGPLGKITLRVNPADYPKAIDFWGGVSESRSPVQVMQDDGIPRASWKVETPEGNIVSHMGRRLETLKKALVEEEGGENAY